MNEQLHRVVGIDLGTTYSAVAAYNTYAISPEIIKTPNVGGLLGAATPSVVWLKRGKMIVGLEAQQAIPAYPENTVIEVKRDMGRREAGADPTAEKDTKPVKVHLGEGSYLPQEISAFILMRMKEIAEAELGGEIYDAVVTVPAYFTERQRKATEEAALLAGLYPRQLIPEPTAAAICYGVDRADLERHVYLVYDLGGGTFDVSIIVAQEDSIEVIATSGNSRLGGGDFDDMIVNWALEQLGITGSAKPGHMRKIKPYAEAAKRDLSLHGDTELQIPPLEGVAAAQSLTLNRKTFEGLIMPLLGKSLDCVDDALRAARADHGIELAAIDAILLVGGSTRIPVVRTMLLDHFGKDEDFVRGDVDPDTVVARGAAIVAYKFAPSETFDMTTSPAATLVNPDLMEQIDIGLITEHSLGIGVENEQGDLRFDRLIARGTRIPVKKMKDNYSVKEGATRVRCLIYQGESEKGYAYETELIGTIELGQEGEIDPHPERPHQFEVTFSLDKNGLLDVHVKHLNSGKEYTANFEQVTKLGKTSKLAERRGELREMYEKLPGGPGPAQPEPIPASRAAGESAAEWPGPLPPPVTAGRPGTAAEQIPPVTPTAQAEPAQPAAAPESAPAPAPASSPALVAIEVEIPAEFRALARRVRRFLAQEPDEALTNAFNVFASALNAAAPEEELEGLGDGLADVFDDARHR